MVAPMSQLLHQRKVWQEAVAVDELEEQKRKQVYVQDPHSLGPKRGGLRIAESS